MFDQLAVPTAYHASQLDMLQTCSYFTERLYNFSNQKFIPKPYSSIFGIHFQTLSVFQR